MSADPELPAPAGSSRDREIVDAKVIVTCPGRNFVTLKIVTRSGITGLGDATLNGRELAVAAYLQEHIVPNLIGKDAGRIEDTWQFFYRGAYWRRGPVTMTAIAAVDVALWDIVAKLAGLPLYQMLGGRSREGALVYAHANGRDIAETSDEVARYIGMGFRAVRAQCAVPEVFPHDYHFRDGRLHCGESPGHGVSIDETLAAKYPYSPKQLPIARLEDGAMWDW